MAIEYLDKNSYWKAKIKWEPPRKWYKNKEDLGVYLNKRVKNKYGIYRKRTF